MSAQPLLLLTLLLTITHALRLEVNKQLPQLKTETYSFRAEDPVNVTTGEQFAIGVSQFDIQRVPDDLRVFEISQEKFINMFETMEKHTGNQNPNDSRKQVDKNIFSCTIKSPVMEIIRTLNVFNQKPSNKFSFSSQKSVIYVPIRSHQLLYTLDTATLELQVYHFTPQRMNFLSSAKINMEKPGQKIAMASGSNQNYLYVFSNEGMWSISTNTVLTNVQRLTQGLAGFNSMDHQVDKMYHGAYNYLFALKRHSCIYLIPEQPSPSQTFTLINQYQQNPLIPQDLYVDSRLLYILDMHEGVYVYHILGNGNVEEYDHIVWKSYGNLELVVKEGTLFIRYLDQEGQKIVELDYNSEKREVLLVRYYKSDQIVSAMSVQIVPVSSSQRLYMTREPFLFLLADNGQIEIYPYNVDPRLINSVHNGVKMHMQSITQLIYLYQDIYILITSSSMLYIRLRIQKPQLQCSLPSSTGHIYYQLQFSSNISTCQHYNPIFQHKVHYPSNCHLEATYMIFIDDPDLSRFQKGILYGVVFMVVASFVGGLLCLIQWRNSQLSLIGRIKDEIIKLRDRYRKMQPFTQEEPQPNKGQVQFQLPEALPIPVQAPMHS